MLRLDPSPGNYAAYVYAYNKENLNKYLEKASESKQEKTSLLGRVEANKAMIKEQQKKKNPAKNRTQQER